MRVDRQVPSAIRYKDMIFDAAFRADLVIEERVLVELKSVEQISEAHKKQVTNLSPVGEGTSWVSCSTLVKRS